MSWKDPRLRNNNSYYIRLPVWLIDEIPLSGKRNIDVNGDGYERCGLGGSIRPGVHDPNQESCLQEHSPTIKLVHAI